MKRIGLILVGLIILGAIGLVAYWAIWPDRAPPGTGFGVHLNAEGHLVGPRRLWDWMDLILVPLALALAGLWFSQVQKKTEQDIASQEREVDREVARDRRHQGTLEAYFDRMTELLLEKKLGTTERNEKGDDPEGGQDDVVASIARARTLAVLRTLDPVRVSAVFRFLLETKVGEQSLAEIVPLASGNLRGVQWAGRKADLREAILSGADLREAILGRANLSRADLRDAKLYKAILRGADLSGADLREAHVVTDQLLQVKTLEGATMPDGTKYEEWIKRQESENGEDEETS